MNVKTRTKLAEYFGFKVEVISMLEHCALIRFGGREFVVDATDLVFIRKFRCAA